ncbi:MCM-domain-containing protein [Moesziomyces antarcticus]|uniref:DNA replication licensing factor MCM5 n=2 Tax=Pseudozyma antarctica TaxID=84753 RepID=A0A081CM46_PSEA2|nr:MCM-domain-containing protein [Moesziomyces antarcticus]GAK67742.1 MCM-domain-containing protein [Moesziomyces antarcticus]SPO49027.1 probable CDC46 - cell division control protein [Moesziomyces antarcticus]
MSGFDAGRVFSAQALAGSEASRAPDAPAQTEQTLFNFVQTFRTGSDYVYRDRLRANLLARQYVLEVQLEHIQLWSNDLAQALRDTPSDILPLFESAVKRAARAILYPVITPGEPRPDAPDCQVTLRSHANLTPMRDLHADSISHLVRVPGIVIGTTTLSSRATHIQIMCRDCRATKSLPVVSGFGGFTLPRYCDSTKMDTTSPQCSTDPYVILHDKCRFVDNQTVKLQEAPDMVPVGELPRHMLMSVDRALCGRVVPGSRIIATGIYSTFASAKGGKGSKAGAFALRTPYLRVVGLEIDAEGAGGRGMARIFSAEEEEEFARISRSPELYENFSASIAPSIFGNQDIKKAIACLLFGGSKKVLPDGMRLRGDINVLMLGDPGTAKSQLLKFVEKVSPIAVYTSGKGSSAAGLTASVQRDPQSREFYLEGGAMVLADGGVVCIDEFDKMRDEDRVAIHESMEQQTISIAKAGITTILNTRTSVLAAANPIFGRYDDMKSPGENIDFQTTVLSRFDMIFIVKDEHNEQRDRTMAKHVMNIHMNRANDTTATGEFDIEQMKRYISFCKARCAPRLSPEAAEKLSSHFVALRKQVAQVERDNDERSSIPITVRQLEAIVRISESLAKVTLSPTVGEEHVDEAMRLFRSSTMDAVQAGNVEGMTRGELAEECQKLEREIRRRLPIGWSTSYGKLRHEFVESQGYTNHALERTLFILEKRDVIRFTNQRKMLTRTGV